MKVVVLGSDELLEVWRWGEGKESTCWILVHQGETPMAAFL